MTKRLNLVAVFFLNLKIIKIIFTGKGLKGEKQVERAMGGKRKNTIEQSHY